MSLVSSISNAISGLAAQSSCMANISDNLANSSTCGYKTIGTSFQDMVSTGTALQTGAGTLATPTYYNNLQGAVASVSSETYMAISGRGYFAVETEDGEGNPSSSDGLYYTRSGDFSLNRNGYLANSAGFCLMGWDVDPTTGAVGSSLVPIQISDLVDAGMATATLDYEANLPASLDTGKTTADSKTSIYDADSVEHEIKYSWEKTGTNTWQLTISGASGAYDATTGVDPGFSYTADFVFTDKGALQSVTSADCDAAGTSLSYDLSYLYTDPVTHATHVDTQTITSNFANVTQFAADTLDVTAFEQDGVPAGSFSDLEIDDAGFVSLNYDNGVTKTYYQVPITTFNAPELLQRVSGTAYQATDLAGTATVSAADTNGAGKLISNAIEDSTVDVADQFTRMVQAQQAYSANAKTISTADSMMQTLVTL